MTAQSSDSIAPNTAIEKAAGKSVCMRSKLQLMTSPCAFGIFQGKANSGSTFGMPCPVVPSDKVYWNAVPMVSTEKPNCPKANAMSVPIMTAGKWPGTGKRSLCHCVSINKVTTPTAVFAQLIVGSAVKIACTFSI